MAGIADVFLSALAAAKEPVYRAGDYLREKSGIESLIRTSIEAPYQNGYSEENEINGDTDAFRHLMISGMLANKFGRIPAKIMGYAHEAASPNGYNAFLMDIQNNDVGSRIGASLPSGATPSAIAEAMQQAMKGARYGAPPGLLQSSPAPVFMEQK